jgi:hypothetical protein
VRQVIVQRPEQGQSAGLIARSLGLVSRSVRQLLQRLCVQGNNALLTSYSGRADGTTQINVIDVLGGRRSA